MGTLGVEGQVAALELRKKRHLNSRQRLRDLTLGLSMRGIQSYSRARPPI